jgi:uncharacterized protein DUF1579
MRAPAVRRAWPSLVLAVAAALSWGPGAALAAPDDKPPVIKGKVDAATEAYMNAATPGAQHARLARMAGHWTTQVKAWFTPGQPVAESTGTMDITPILGGRYVESVHKGQMMGQPFEGREIDGYDNVAGQYVSSWIDNGGTGVLLLTGQADASGKVVTMTGDFVDPATRKKVTYKGVQTLVDDDTMRYESYMVAGDKETKIMEILAKRAK